MLKVIKNVRFIYELTYHFGFDPFPISMIYQVEMTQGDLPEDVCCIRIEYLS